MGEFIARPRRTARGMLAAERAGTRGHRAGRTPDDLPDRDQRDAGEIPGAQLGIFPWCPWWRMALGQAKRSGTGIDRPAASPEVRGDVRGRILPVAPDQFIVLHFAPRPAAGAAKPEHCQALTYRPYRSPGCSGDIGDSGIPGEQMAQRVDLAREPGVLAERHLGKGSPLGRYHRRRAGDQFDDDGSVGLRVVGKGGDAGHDRPTTGTSPRRARSRA